MHHIHTRCHHLDLETKLKRLGEIDENDFLLAYERLQERLHEDSIVSCYNSNARLEALNDNPKEMLGILNEKIVQNSNWQIFKVEVIQGQSDPQFILQRDDRVLIRIQEVFGQEICNMVIKAKLELINHNPIAHIPINRLVDDKGEFVNAAHAITSILRSILQHDHILVKNHNCEDHRKARPEEALFEKKLQQHQILPNNEVKNNKEPLDDSEEGMLKWI